MIHGPAASQLMRALCACCDNMSATPSVWCASSSSCPEYRVISSVFSLTCPDCVHLVSHSPSTVMLYACLSLAIWAPLFASYMVLSFHVPMFEIFLEDKKAIGNVASLWFSLHGVILSQV